MPKRIRTLTSKLIDSSSDQVECFITDFAEVCAGVTRGVDHSDSNGEIAGVVKGMANATEEFEFNACDYFWENQADVVGGTQAEGVDGIRNDLVIARAALNRVAFALGARVSRRSTIAKPSKDARV